MKNQTIKVDYLARVEGEGAILVKIKGGEIAEVKFNIFEPPRFFEAFLRGRKYSEAPDITSRICGICPIAYQMSSVHAMENAFGVTVDWQLRELRRLIYCGEWIESHVLHIYMLHAPDFLGYEDALQLAKDYPEIVKKGLQLKKAGNDIVALLGGREIHPINVRVGGFYRVPSKKELASLTEKLKWARDAAIDTVKWTATLPFPDFEQDYEFVSLRHPDEYPFNEGRIVSNKGLDIAVKEYEFSFEEEHVSHSNALHSLLTTCRDKSVLKGRGAYFVGPMARFNLNFDKLSPIAKDAAKEVGVLPEVRNPFKSIIVRAVETLYACDEALRIISQYEPPEKSCVEIPSTPPFTKGGHGGVGFGCTEAPRGMIYHRYRIGADGLINDAKIVPPTSQNQRIIEEDLRNFVIKNISLPKEELTWKCEQTVRNYDPCISCATHLLKIEFE
ncbi:MAG: Ni/Fe hydrogenase subunit alpha [Nitrospinae bacterium]|nr:Ni/Fe hydrogenase subunit alpha [Nitrospinota bacterium]